MAPEVISGTRYSAAADVYSFGVVLAELSTHQVPYSDAVHPETGRALTQQPILSSVTTGELQPTFDATTPAYVKEWGNRCLATNPDDRPTTLELTLFVRELVQCSSTVSL
ncbi:hypothetical protein SDRG_13981 [Saprolegnia diclina VS20]|uniref:Protein kinase domain-containing protein n=1 Tax=Saprolegnia diclina (strain VS20) TaxID=1156394 RepID=T0Q4D6_SAPDV|nr:hypothetical protein SDRG_13981 [Saprolegnia diclina VS20]EQC28300.1 hypothetical protein SDRG_13981 [Saprolegnia diclina VS20]|eukprot:XP_008618304.1 hypothetical protein SDRG_13981 [Saprolegnia diclina VS20]